MNRQGSSNRLIYDECAYSQDLNESVSPFQYRTYMGAYESCGKCKYDTFWHPFDAEIVDVESELKNITRPGTKCSNLKYHPACKKSKQCISTFDPSRPVVWSPEICPVVKNNIPKLTTTGVKNPLPFNCQ